MKKIFLILTLIWFNYFLFSQNKEWIIYNTTNCDIGNNFIKCLAIDSSAKKWVGTTSGLSMFDDYNWNVYNITNSILPDNKITSLLIEGKNIVWIGTEKGLAQFNGFDWLNYTIQNSEIPDPFIFSLAVDDSGNKWLGSQSFKIIKFDGTNWYLYKNDYSYGEHIFTVAIDSSDYKWLGTEDDWNDGSLGILSKFDGTNWFNFIPGESDLPLGGIYSIVIDKYQNKWIGKNENGGLIEKKDSIFTLFNTTNSGLPNNNVYTIAIDENNVKWIGTRGGLAKFDDTSWTVWDTDNSDLPSNSINCIVIDKYGNKWIGTDNGLAVFREGGVVGVENQGDSKNVLIIFPNPTENTLNLRYHIETAGMVNIFLTDVLGNQTLLKSEYKFPGDYVETFNLSVYPQGIYNVVLQMYDKVYSERVIVSR